MQFQTRKLVTILATSLFSLACNVSDNDSQPLAHACDRDFNSDWTSVSGLEITHSDPNTCPVDKGPGDSNMAGGLIEETNAPDFPSFGATKGLTLAIYDTYSTNVYVGGGLLALASDWFEREFGTSGRWLAQAFANYTVGNNPDWIEFSVVCNPGCGFPIAWLEIQYAGQPE